MKRHWENITNEDSSAKRLHIDPIDSIPLGDDILSFLIFNFIPVYQWPKLEIVAQQFRRATLTTYRMLRKWDIYDFFPEKRMTVNFSVHGVEKQKSKNVSEKFENFLMKIRDWSPKLNKLRGFDCFTDKIYKKHFEILKGFKNLACISFEKCRLDIIHFADFIKNMENLTDLNLSGCTFIVSKNANLPISSPVEDSELVTKFDVNLMNAEVHLETLATVTCLTSLNLSGISTLSGKFLSYVKTDELVTLNLSGTHFFAGYVYEFLQNCTKLETLDLSPVNSSTVGRLSRNTDVGLSRIVFQCLPHLAHLRSLKIIGYNNVKSSAASDLARALGDCKRLNELCLVDNVLVTTDVVLAIINGCQDLQVLRLDVSSLISPTLCKLVNLRYLKTLGFYSNKDLAWQVDDAVVSILPRLKFLESINLHRPAVSHSILETLCKVEKLQKIRISGRSITNAVVVKWCLTIGHQLISLDIPYCESISDSTAVHLANNCKKLQRLNLSFSKITDVAVRKFASECKELREVDFTQNRSGKVTSNSLMTMLSNCEDMNFLKVKRSVINALINDDSFKKFKLSVKLFCGFTD